MSQKRDARYIPLIPYYDFEFTNYAQFPTDKTNTGMGKVKLSLHAQQIVYELQGTTRSVKYDSKKQAFFQPDPHEMWGWAASTIEDQLYMGGKNNVSVVKRTKATSEKRGWSTIGVPFVGLAGRKYIISTHFVLGSYADARRVPTSSAGVISGASAKIDLKVGFPRP